MIRLANPGDARQLFLLNQQFNGEGVTTLEALYQSLLDNRQEFAVVAEENGSLLGFACVQLKRSLCYDKPAAEVTEVYVAPLHRRRGIAEKMLQFAEEHCKTVLGVAELELLTGKKNIPAQRLYQKLGYKETGRIHFVKREEKP